MDLSELQKNLLLEKIKSDLSLGYKVLGNNAVQFDEIRVWCLSQNRIKRFAVVATSGLRFGNTASSIELRSFGEGTNYALSILLIEQQMKEMRIESFLNGNDYLVSSFYNDIISAQVDKDYTQTRMLAEGHNQKDLVYEF